MTSPACLYRGVNCAVIYGIKYIIFRSQFFYSNIKIKNHSSIQGSLQFKIKARKIKSLMKEEKEAS